MGVNAMLDKDPTTIPLVNYLYMIGIAVWGAVIDHFGRLKKSRKHFHFGWLLFDIVTSGFVGIVVMWACQAIALDWLTTGVIVGMSGHLGSRTVVLLSKKISRRLDSML